MEATITKEKMKPEVASIVPMQLTDELKIKMIESHFVAILKLLGLDLNDDSIQKTPNRVAKMLVKEIFSGLNPANKPKITVFKNRGRYSKPVIERNITAYSFCEHHFLPIIGKAHLAYIPNGKIIGLSKLNRIGHYCASKPQVQERLTEEIAAFLKEALQIDDVAVVIDAMHLCVAARGIKDTSSTTVT
ncbi:MAG: GTP cyclohydrolase I FolE, partial [Chitinophagaceae bacterium]